MLGIGLDLYFYRCNICQQMLYLSFSYFSSLVVIVFSVILWPPGMYHSKDIRHRSFYGDRMPFLPIHFYYSYMLLKVEKRIQVNIKIFVVFLRYIVIDKPFCVASVFYFSMFFLVATMYGYNGFFCHHGHDDDDHVRRVCD